MAKDDFDLMFEDEIDEDEDFDSFEESEEFNVDSFGESGNDYSDDDAVFRNINETNNGQKITKKVGIILVASGMVAFVIIYIIYNALIGANSKVKKTESNDKETSASSSLNAQENNPNEAENSGNIMASIPTGIDWKSIQKADVEFEEGLKDTDFTVLSINHYTKIGQGNTDIQLISIVSGNLRGFQGVYDIIIPYEKAVMLNPKNEFKVSVKVGEYKGMRVVGGIFF